MRSFISSRFAPLIILTLVVLIIPILSGSNLIFRLAALVYVFGIAALGLNILMGYAGQVSLGHPAFFGIGAYATAVGPTQFGISPGISALIGVIVAGLVAWGVGRLILKLKGLYLALATLALGVLVSLVLSSEVAITGGPDGIQVERLIVFGWRVSGVQTWYWVTAAIMLFAVIIASNLEACSSGRAYRALHDSEIAASVAGIDIAAMKIQAFVISAIYAAIAGVLLAFMNGFITPDIAGLNVSIEMVAMVVIGGIGSVLGSIVGAAFIVLLPQTLSSLHEYEIALLGLLVVGFMIALPAGIVPGLRNLVARGRQ